jgi:hypothetical protein
MTIDKSTGAHPTYYPVGTGGFFFTRGKAAGTWIWPLTSISDEIKNTWIYTTTPPYFMSWCLVKYKINVHDLVIC